MFGTTDVTRTISLENKSNYIKRIYIAQGHITQHIKLKNTNGRN